MDNKMISFTQKDANQLAAQLGALILRKDHVLVLNHLLINPNFSKQAAQLEEKLVDQAVEFAQKQGLKIWPLGPHARQTFFKRPDSQAWLYHKEDK